MPPADPDRAVSEEWVLPIVQERIDVGRERHETGAVRVRIEVDRALQALDLPVSDERVEVERRARGEPVGERREPWLEGEVLVVPVYEEVLVTERRLVLREEIRLTRRRESRIEHHEVPLARQRAVLERRGADGLWRPEPGGMAAKDEIPPGPGPASPIDSEKES